MHTNHTLTDAQMQALSRLIVRVAARHPELTTRALRAADLVPHVRRVGHDTFEVPSQSEPGKTYYVSAVACTCQDSYYRAPVVDGLRTCKHRLALMLAHKLGLLTRERPADSRAAHDALLVYQQARRVVDNLSADEARAYVARAYAEWAIHPPDQFERSIIELILLLLADEAALENEALEAVA